jgi:hypothetical protein
MKRFLLHTVLGFLMINQGFSQEDSTILEIRDNFKKWQPIIDIELDSSDKLYNYAWGENYQFEKWTDKMMDNDSLILSEAVSIIKKKGFGYFVHRDTFSFSGDWYVVADFYYDKNGQLYFIFWRMNTFYAEEPLSVEKRLYLDKHGQLILDLKSVYKMNTKEKLDKAFSDRAVDYNLTLNDMDFYKYWNQNQKNKLP